MRQLKDRALKMMECLERSRQRRPALRKDGKPVDPAADGID